MIFLLNLSSRKHPRTSLVVCNISLSQEDLVHGLIDQNGPEHRDLPIHLLEQPHNVLHGNSTLKTYTDVTAPCRYKATMRWWRS